MAVNAQKIQQFNQKNQQAAGTPAPGTPAPVTPASGTPPPPPKIHSRMSVADIALLQKDPATLTKEEVIRRKALETKETLRQKEELDEKQRQEQLEADRKAGRLASVVSSETARGLKALDKTTSPQRAWIMRAPTVGGIGALLAIIALFLMAVVPIDKQGHTRLFLIWLTLTGKTGLKYSPQSPLGPNVTPTTTTPVVTPVVPATPTPVTPDTTTTFTLPSIFQNGGSNLFSSLFGGD